MSEEKEKREMRHDSFPSIFDAGINLRVKTQYSALLRRSLSFLLSCAVIAGMGTPVWAHETDMKRPPTKAGKEMVAARKLLDAAKLKLLAAGRYSCCVKPPTQSKVNGCDWCARTLGSCKCGVSLSEGKGVCGDCLGGWKRGEGMFPDIDRKAVKLLASSAQAMEPQAGAPVLPELAQAREMLLKLKRVLVMEQRFTCCIKQGGCDECALEASCPCALETQKKESKGVCSQCYDGWHNGQGRIAGMTAQDMKHNHERMGEMIAMRPFAGLSVLQQGSGTSWQPEATPMFAAMRDIGVWGLMTHYNVFLGYDRQEGPRGDYQVNSLNNVMFMGRRFSGEDGLWTLRAMFSLDALTATPAGYPLLLQSGESYGGQALIDRQHPHDFFMELGAQYAHKLGDDSAAWLYFAPVGEPALGPVAFPHRLSALDIPAAPISHHWQDSSHITYGVATLGAWRKNVQVEASVFTGREPDEHRWNFDPMRFDSYAARVTWNPGRNWSLQASYGYLHSPEALHPGEDLRRTTASAMYVLPRKDGGFWATTLVWGRNNLARKNTDSYLLETSLNLGQRNTIFGRFEYVQKSGEELDILPEERVFGMGQFTLGYVYDFTPKSPFQTGIGAAVTWNAIPSELESLYGRSPMGFWVFVRIRPKAMR